MSTTTFKMINQSQNVVANKLNYEIVPKLQSYEALQVGDYKLSARTSDYNGWLVCNGRLLSVSDFADLYEVIGTNFGSAPGQFRLPDYTSRVVGMFGASAAGSTLTQRSRGEVAGSETILLTVGQLPPHLHTGTTDSSGAHVHGVTDPGHAHSYVNNVYDQNTDNVFGSETAADQADVNQTSGTSYTGLSVNEAGSHVHTFTSNNTGNNDPVPIIQPTLFGASVLIFSKFIARDDLEPTPWDV